MRKFQKKRLTSFRIKVLHSRLFFKARLYFRLLSIRNWNWFYTFFCSHIARKLPKLLSNYSILSDQSTILDEPVHKIESIDGRNFSIDIYSQYSPKTDDWKGNKLMFKDIFETSNMLFFQFYRCEISTFIRNTNIALVYVRFSFGTYWIT